MNKLFCIIGESCTGKDTILKELLKRIKQENIPIKLLPSNTTRPMRSGEKQGEEYNFTSNETFYDYYRNNDLLEYTTYNTAFGIWHYYTLKNDLNLKLTNYIKIINPIGLSQISDQIQSDNLKVIRILVPEEERLKRLINRGDNEEEIKRRLEQDRQDFKWEKYDLVVNNVSGINVVVDNILEYIKKEIR